MISNILKSNRPFVIIFILLLGGLIWLTSFIEPISMVIPADQINMPFYQLIFGQIDKNSILSVTIAFIFVVIQAFLLVQFNKQNIIINYRTYLPAFFYIMITGSFIHMHRINPAIVGTPFLFISISYIYRTYREDYALNKLYLAGFFIALATLFWASFAIFFFIIWISLTILRPFIGREWVVGIFGFLTPLLFVFTYYFVFTEGRLKLISENLMANFELANSLHALQISYVVFFVMLSLLIIFSSYTMIFNFQKKKIKNRKYFEINWWMFLIGIVIFIVFKNVKYEIIYVLAIPISFLFTDYFYTIKRTWYLDSILVLFFIMIAYIQIAAHL